MESTSAETLATIYKYVGRNNDTVNNISSILEVADFVKFAKMQPLPDENVRCMNYAFEIVEATRPIPQPDQNAAPVAAQPNIKTN